MNKNHRIISVLLILPILISLFGIHSISFPVLNDTQTNTFTLTLKPRVIYTSNNSIIKYDVVQGRALQYYVSNYYAAPLINVITINLYGYTIENVSIELSNPIILTLNKPLLRTLGPISLDTPYTTYRNFTVIIPRRLSYNTLSWRGLIFTVMHIRPVDIINEYQVIIYSKISITTSYRYTYMHIIPDPKVLNIIESMSINKPQIPVNVDNIENPIILVITRSMFKSYLLGYIGLKQRQGYDVVIATVEDIVNSGIQGRDIPEKIRNYIFNKYIEYGNNLEYVVIIGDANGAHGWPNGPYELDEMEPWEVPTRYFYNPDGMSSYSHTGNYTPSDWYYVTLDSTWDTNYNGIYGEIDDDSDWAPDISIGRIPVKTIDELREYLHNLSNYNRSSIDYWLLTGSTLWFYGEYGNPDYGGQGDTRAEALWMNLNNSQALYRTLPLRLYEHYPVLSIIDDPSDQNGNLSKDNMLFTLYNYHPDIVTWFAHGSAGAACRKIWSADNNFNGYPDGDEITWETFITRYDLIESNKRDSLIVAMSCLTAYFDIEDSTIDSLGEKFLKTLALWYIGWNRVTWDFLLTFDWEIEPRYWGLSSGAAYRFLNSLLNDTSLYKYDVGYSLTYALTWLGISYYMDSEVPRKVWWALTLLGDPSQPFNYTSVKPLINIYPEKGHVGSIIHIYGSGFTPNTTATVYFDDLDTPIGYVDIDYNGDFSTYVQIPVSPIEPGNHTIIVEDMGGLMANISFIITSPVIDINTSNSSTGEPICIRVSNLTPKELYYIVIDNSTILSIPYITGENGYLEALMVLSVNNNSTIEYLPSLPLLIPGTHSISIIYNPWYYNKWNGNFVLPVMVGFTTFNITWGAASTSDINELKELINELNDKIEKDYEELYELINNVKSVLENKIVANITMINSTLREFIAQQINEVEIQINNTIVKIENIIKDNITSLNESLRDYIDQRINNVVIVVKELRSYIDNVVISNITSINETLQIYMEKQVNDLRHEIKTLGERMDQLSQNISGLQIEISNIDDVVNSFIVTLNMLQKNVNSLMKDVISLNNSIAHVNELIFNLRNEINVIQQSINKINSTLFADLIHDLNSINNSLSKLKNVLMNINNSLIQNIKNLNSSIRKLYVDLSTLQSKIDDLSIKVEKLEENHTSPDIDSPNEQSQQIIYNLEKQLYELSQELDRTRQINYILSMVAIIMAFISIAAIIYMSKKKHNQP